MAVLDLLYPPRCVNCGRFRTSLCDPCEEAMQSREEFARCAFCRARWDGDDNCPRCFGLDAIDAVRVAFDYEGPARNVVRNLKYRNNLALAPIMACYIEPLCQPDEFDAVFAVPLHSSRLRYRGFNQAQLLRDALALPPAEGSLLRIRRTHAQFGLSSRRRSANVAGAFAYRGPRIQDCRVAIIDDVVTTGATANECARVLRDAGAVHVTVIAFARANYEPAAPDDALHV